MVQQLDWFMKIGMTHTAWILTADGPWHRLIKAYLDPKRDLQGKRILGIDSDGVGHYFLFPRMLPRQITILDNARFLMRWLALHSLVVAEKAFANRRP